MYVAVLFAEVFAVVFAAGSLVLCGFDCCESVETEKAALPRGAQASWATFGAEAYMELLHGVRFARGSMVLVCTIGRNGDGMRSFSGRCR
jgi:hypothetical protein